MPSPLCAVRGHCPYARRKLHPPGATSALTTPISHISPPALISSCHILHLLSRVSSSFSSLSTRGSFDSMARRTTNNSGSNVLARPAGPTPRTRALSPPTSRRTSMYTIGEGTSIQLHWLFRSNIPRRRGMPMPTDVRKRNFFGIGEIIGVLANVRISSCSIRARWRDCGHVV